MSEQPGGDHWPAAHPDQGYGDQGYGDQGYADPYGQPPAGAGGAAQQWQGRTWETHVQPAVPHDAAAETAYLPQADAAGPPPGQQQSWGGQGHQDNGHPGHGHGYPQQPASATGHQDSGSYGNGSYGDGSYGGGSYGSGSYGGNTYGGNAYGDGSYGGEAYPAAGGDGSYGGRAAYGGQASYGNPAAPRPQPPARPQPQPQPQPQPPLAAEPPAEPAAAASDGYGPPTLAGNARVTDAQRARAEGRSPIIEPGIQPAGLTLLLGLLLAGGAAAIGSYGLLVPLVLLQAVTAAGWFRLNGMWPARQGIALAFLGGVVADVVLLAVGREYAPAAILGTLGVWVLLCLVLQLRSHAPADERISGLMATVVSAALAVVAAGYLGADPDAATAGTVAVAVAVFVRALPLPLPMSVVVSLAAGGAGGFAAGGADGLGGRAGLLLGLGAALCAVIGHRVAGYDYPSRFVHMTAGVALPLTAAAPLVYALGEWLG